MTTPMPFVPSEASSTKWKYRAHTTKGSINTNDTPVANVQPGVYRDVQVDVIEVSEITFTSGTRKGGDGLMLKLVVRDKDDDALWAFFEQTKENFARTFSKSFQDFCGNQFEITEIHYQRGSIVLTIFVGVNTWAIAHQGVLSLISVVFGIYQPLKALIADSQKWIPRLQTFIVAFFRGRPMTPLLIRH